MFISDAVDYLNKSLGLSLDTSYYSHIAEWLDWWRGFHQPFHVYTEAGVSGQPVRRELYKLRMAKKVCEDWASLLLNDKVYITCSDKKSEDFLIGRPYSTLSINEAPDKNKGMSGILADTGFFCRANHMLELAFATGTGAVITRVTGAKILPDGTVINSASENANSANSTVKNAYGNANSANGTVKNAYGKTIAKKSAENTVKSTVKAETGSAKIEYEFVDASHIIPLTIRGGEVIDAAFCSETVTRGKPSLYIETHILKDGRYHIKNSFFNYDNGVLTPAPVPDGVASEIVTPDATPMFALVSPNIANDINPLSGLGISVFADAIDCLKGVDLAFNNFCRDLKLGGKKVFVNQTLVRRDDSGNIFTPDDIAQQLFQTIGDSDFSDKPLITEHNPELRTEENASAVQHQLDYLSFKCGLGARYFSFGSSSRNITMTATQYSGERQDLIRCAARHSQNIKRMLMSVFRATLKLANSVLSEDLDPDCAIAIRFDDSFILDDESVRERDRLDVREGLMTPEEYRGKYLEKGFSEGSY